MADKTMTIGRLLAILWRRKLLFLSAVILASGAIIARAYLATPVYRVASKVMVRQGESGLGGVQSLLGQFGGLASLAGIGIAASVDEQEAIAWLKSRSLFEEFANREDLLPVLFPRAWDPVAKRWRSDLKRVPTMDDAWSVFDRNIRAVNQDSRTKIVSVEISWANRQQAAAWANELVRQANEELRQRALREADASLNSLREQLDQTQSVELRQSIYNLMEAQINRKMVARSRPDYAFAVLDPAVVPDAERFASPRRSLLQLIAIPFGLLVGSFVVLAMEWIPNILAGLRSSATGS